MCCSCEAAACITSLMLLMALLTVMLSSLGSSLRTAIALWDKAPVRTGEVTWLHGLRDRTVRPGLQSTTTGVTKIS